MAKLDRETYMDYVKRLVGDRDDDEALSIVESFSETYDDWEDRAGEDWRERYKENDAEWRRKYKERFFGGKAEDVERDKETSAKEVKREQEEDVRRDGTIQTFESLFEKREG